MLLLLGHMRRKLKRTILWTSVVLGTVLLLIGIIKIADTPAYESSILSDSVAESDWVKGNREAKTILVEYSDFQCPACRYYHPWLNQLLQKMGEDVAFVYRHFPLPQHKNAEPAAWAAEAAGMQDKFWEMYDLIFETQDAWSNVRGVTDIFGEYAEDLDLDVERFINDLESKDIKNKVENSYLSGIQSRVNSTPTFFLNGVKIQNPASYEELKEILSESIKNNP